MATNQSLGSTSQVSGSGVRDKNERNNLARTVQQGDQSKKKKDDGLSALQNAAANKSMPKPGKKPTIWDDMDQTYAALPKPARVVCEGLGASLMASLALGVAAGALVGVADVDLGGFFEDDPWSWDIDDAA